MLVKVSRREWVRGLEVSYATYAPCNYLEIKDNMRALHLLSGVEMAPAHRLNAVTRCHSRQVPASTVLLEGGSLHLNTISCAIANKNLLQRI